MAIRRGSIIVAVAARGAIFSSAFTAQSIPKGVGLYPLSRASRALFSTSSKSVVDMAPSASAPSVSHFIDSTNAQYEVLHKDFEMQFWGTKSELVCLDNHSPATLFLLLTTEAKWHWPENPTPVSIFDFACLSCALISL